MKIRWPFLELLLAEKKRKAKSAPPPQKKKLKKGIVNNVHRTAKKKNLTLSEKFVFKLLS